MVRGGGRTGLCVSGDCSFVVLRDIKGPLLLSLLLD